MTTEEITNFEIEVLDWKKPFLTIKTSVSKGTYIRSLARDIAYACGSCAYLKQLRRTKVDTFSVENAVKIDEFTSKDCQTVSAEYFKKLDINIAEIKVEYIPEFLNGKEMSAEFFIEYNLTDGLYAVFTAETNFIGLIEISSSIYSYKFVGESI